MMEPEYKTRPDGSYWWYLNNQLHRTDGPAAKSPIGTYWWYQKGLLHRVDGPAVEWADGRHEWYLFGHEMTKEEHEINAAKGELYVKMRYG